MTSLAGLIQFEQLFISRRKFLRPLRQSHRQGLPSGGNGVVETSGFGIGRSESSDWNHLFVLGLLTGPFGQAHRLGAVAQAGVGGRGPQPGKIIQSRD